MEFQIPNFAPAAAELFLAGMAVFILLVVSFMRRGATATAYWLSQLTLIATAFIAFWYLWLAPFFPEAVSEVRLTFGTMYIDDPLGDGLKTLVCLSVAGALLYGRRYMADRNLESSEYYLIVLFATLGMLVLISAANLLTVFMGLELMSLSSYALVAIDRDSPRATEAAMKYFVLGALSSGLLLYGMSMVYGATGTLSIGHVAQVLRDPEANRTILLFGLVFVMAGVAFKLGVAPFHMWIPDVYHGAPSAVTLLISSAPKLAAFVMVFRLLVEGMWDLAVHWQQMLMFLSVASMVLGNLAAIAQRNLKRMLAYSAIGHMGYMLLGLITSFLPDQQPFSHVTYNATASSLFYVVTYVLTTVAGFGILLLMSRAGFEAEEIDDFKGLNRRSSWWAAMMAIVMLSMAGLPFFVGFFAKFFVLQSVITGGHLWLAVVAIVTSLIGAYYYLRIVKVMYFDDAVDTAPILASGGARVVLSLNVLAIAALGLFPNYLMQLCVLLLQASV